LTRLSLRTLWRAGCLSIGWATGLVSQGAAVQATVADAPAAGAVATGARRDLGLHGAPNFRDIGGYETTDGHHLRWGVVYRSNALDKLTPADAERVAALNLAAVVDLRTQEERAHSPSVWLREPADRYESPKPTLGPVMQTILAEAQTAAGARSGMNRFYSDMPHNYRTEYSALFHRVAAGKLPLLVHCTAGKDRTGVAIALLLLTVGVPTTTVVQDYKLTDTLVPAPVMAKQGPAPLAGAQSALAGLPEESRVALWQSRAEYIDAALDAIGRQYGSVNGYLARALGLSDAEIGSIRRRLID